MPRPTQSARIWLSLAALCIAAIQANIAAAEEVALVDPCPPTPLEAEVLADGGSGRFARHTLIEAALTAGGVDRFDRLQAYSRKYAEFSRTIQIGCRGQESARERARIILESMHRDILTGGYDPAVNQLS